MPLNNTRLLNGNMKKEISYKNIFLKKAIFFFEE